MPLITFESGKLPDEVKAELIRRLTDTAVEVTGIPKGTFFVSLREQPDENVAIGGKTVREIKADLGR